MVTLTTFAHMIHPRFQHQPTSIVRRIFHIFEDDIRALELFCDLWDAEEYGSIERRMARK